MNKENSVWKSLAISYIALMLIINLVIRLLSTFGLFNNNINVFSQTIELQMSKSPGLQSIIEIIIMVGVIIGLMYIFRYKINPQISNRQSGLHSDANDRYLKTFKKYVLLAYIPLLIVSILILLINFNQQITNFYFFWLFPIVIGLITVTCLYQLATEKEITYNKIIIYIVTVAMITLLHNLVVVDLIKTITVEVLKSFIELSDITVDKIKEIIMSYQLISYLATQIWLVITVAIKVLVLKMLIPINQEPQPIIQSSTYSQNIFEH